VVTVDQERLKAAWAKRADGQVGLSSAVYQVLADALLTGDIPAGSRIVENDFVDLFSVSRTPIREAVLRLKTEGYLTRTDDGRLVASEITAEDIVDVYDVREVLTALAARLAAERAHAPSVARMRAVHRRFADAVEARDPVAMFNTNIAFHEEIFRAAGNTFLLELGQQVHTRVRRFPGTTFAQEHRGGFVLEEHAQLIDAIEARDPELAESIAHAHVEHARQSRITQLWG
jgi:Transcriptional regulators